VSEWSGSGSGGGCGIGVGVGAAGVGQEWEYWHPSTKYEQQKGCPKLLMSIGTPTKIDQCIPKTNRCFRTWCHYACSSTEIQNTPDCGNVLVECALDIEYDLIEEKGRWARVSKKRSVACYGCGAV
jgi:hypothetical protein